MNDPYSPEHELDPLLDVARLQEIADLDLFAPEVNDILFDLAREASLKLNLPLGMVNLVLDEAQYVASHYGVEGWIGEVLGTPIEWAFCRFAVRDRTDFVVNDALYNDRVKDNPLVTEEGLRCYAGIPLITSRGYAIGSFCVAGTEPHNFDEKEMHVLRELAREAMRRIETRRVT